MNQDSYSPPPHILFIPTGGTIAGWGDNPLAPSDYRAASIDGEALLDSVPFLRDLALVTCRSPFNLDSKELGPSEWLMLGNFVRAGFDDPEIDAIVITHGTDTLEETAYFLDLVTPPGKPVILTAAMRPASAPSADGPANLRDAFLSACRPELAQAGVVVVFNGLLHAAREVCKRHTSALDAISASPLGVLGEVGGPIRFPLQPAHTRPAQPEPATQSPPTDPTTTAPQGGAGHSAPPGRTLPGWSVLPLGSPTDFRHIHLDALSPLPRIDLLWIAAGSSPDLLTACIERGSAGVVLAAPGNGGLPSTWLEAVECAAPFPVVLTSRTGAGRIDSALTRSLPPHVFLCADLPPLKARIRLMLGLAAGLREENLRAWLLSG